MDSKNTLEVSVEEALGLFQTANGKTLLTGKFLSLKSELDNELYQTKDARIQQLIKQIHYINMDIWNIFTLLERMEWFRWVATNNKNLTKVFYWGQFTSLDIELFHTKLRSIFDYMAKILCMLAEKPGQVKNRSFESLYNWNERDERNKTSLGKRLAV